MREAEDTAAEGPTEAEDTLAGGAVRASAMESPVDTGVVVSAVGQGSALASDSSGFHAFIPSTEASDTTEVLDTTAGTTIPTGILLQTRIHILDTTPIMVTQLTKRRQ